MPGRYDRTKTNISTMEHTFITNSTLKRNKRYLDIEKLNNHQKQYSLQRRKPLTTRDTISSKISHSFLSSTAAITDRLEQDIDKFKNRISVFAEGQQPFVEEANASKGRQTARSSRSSVSSKGIKGISIDKSLSREQYYKIRNKPALDEGQFNNFSMEKPDLIHTKNIGEGPQRNFDNSLKHINDINYQTQKLFQKYYYSRKSMHCKVNLKAQSKDERIFFKPKRKQDEPSTDLSPKAVRKSLDAVYKRPNTSNTFYSNSGRQLPCQLDNRNNTALTNFWVNDEGSINRPHLEYSLRKMKQDMRDERKNEIKEKKKPKFKKGQVCDQKFFAVMGVSQ